MSNAIMSHSEFTEMCERFVREFNERLGNGDIPLTEQDAIQSEQQSLHRRDDGTFP